MDRFSSETVGAPLRRSTWFRLPMTGAVFGLGVVLAALIFWAEGLAPARAEVIPVGKTARGKTIVLVRHKKPRPLSDYVFVDVTGKPRKLSEWRGKLLLVNLWGSWCPACREEIPALDRLQGAMGGPDFEVLAINLDPGGPDMPKTWFFASDIENLKVYNDSDDKAQAVFRYVGLPTTVFVDAAGRELGRILGPVKWDEPAIRKLIQKFIAEQKAPPKKAP